MRMFRIGAALAALAVAAPGAARAEDEALARIGPWTITAPDGNRCRAQATGRKVSLSLQRLRDGRWWFGLSSEDWKLPAEGTVGASIKVENNVVLTRARSIEGNWLLMEVLDIGMLGPLRSDQQIELFVMGGRDGMPDQRTLLPLPRIEEVLPALERCAAGLR